jgi:hypothetical protein
MTRTVIEKFYKNPEDYNIKLIVGFDDNPEKAHNAMLYIRMQSTRNDEEPIKTKGIWLSNEELRKFSRLLRFACTFCEKNTLEKNTVNTRKEIRKFKRQWVTKRDRL